MGLNEEKSLVYNMIGDGSQITDPYEKKDMIPEGTLALNWYRKLLIDQIQPLLTFICSLNSNHNFLVSTFENLNLCCRGVLGGPGWKRFP